MATSSRKRMNNLSLTHLLLDSLVNDVNTLVNDRKTFTKLLLIDNKGRVNENSVPAHKGEETVLTQVGTEGSHGT